MVFSGFRNRKKSEATQNASNSCWYCLRAWTFCKTDQKSIQVSLDTGTSLTTEPTTCYLLEAGLYVCIFLLPELSRKYGFQPFSRQPPHPRYAAAETRSLARRRCSAASFRDCAVLPAAPVSPSGTPPSFLSVSVRGSGSPVPLPGALSSPCPGRARSGPYPLTPRCTMPDQSPRACEPQCPCPWAETGGGGAGSRGGERNRFRAPAPGPRAPRELPPQTPAPLGPAARRSPRRPRRRSHGGSS